MINPTGEHCIEEDHRRTGACYECCDQCNYDTHHCLGCGESLKHNGRTYGGLEHDCWTEENDDKPTT